MQTKRLVTAVLGVAMLTSLTTACLGPARTVGGVDDGETGGDGDGDGDGDGHGDGDGNSEPSLPANKNVDILFVIDNSGSMGEEQGKLAANFGAFIQILEAPEIEANYRIGITTTDNGNPWCGANTTPEAGGFVASSCRGRLAHFTFTGTNPPTVVDDIACTDICDLEKSELDDLMRPTATAVDPSPKVRPWIEQSAGKTNLPDGVSPIEAFQCFAPQGIDGCGFESQLESMYKSLNRVENENENNYGFLREGAVLAVVIITDEVDCSYDYDWKEIFEVSGNRVFWSDPDAQYPSSALCWNAGVKCTGGPGAYDDCAPIDYDVNGVPTEDPARMVMPPVSRYTELIQEIEDAKRQLDPDQEVIVGVISGVPEAYHRGAAEIVYADSPDQQFQFEYGIGPGCTSEGQTALPPVRMREWADAFGDRRLYSICSDDYTPAMKAIANAIAGQIRPACYHECVLDKEPSAPGLQPNCHVEQSADGSPKLEVPPCELVGGIYEMPSPETNVCFYYRTDAAQSGDPLDDMSDECVDQGVNLEFAIVRRPGFPAPDGVVMTAQCQPSENPDQDCPNLGG